jgi:hypothetical protein
MSATDKRKTLLERVLESLPSQLSEAYEASARKSSPAHEILRLLVAGQLWNTGYRDISFEKAINGSQGQDAYVDIYVGESNMFVECERMPNKMKILERKRKIAEAYPKSKFTLALQDRMGWLSQTLAGIIGEVWVVSMDGQVKPPWQWVEDRKSLLQSVFAANGFKAMVEDYIRTEDEYRRLARLGEEEKLYWQTLLAKTAIKTSMEAGWLNNLKIRGAWSSRIEKTLQKLNQTRLAITGRVVELLNTILSLSSPYTLKLEEDYSICAGVDWDRWQWLGWKNHPDSNSSQTSQYRILEKNIETELKIATKQLKTILTGDGTGINSESANISQELKSMWDSIQKMEQIIKTLITQ